MNGIDFLERGGWFLIRSFLLGLAGLPLIWFLRSLVANRSTNLRSGIAQLSLLSVTLLPLAGAWLLDEPTDSQQRVSKAETDQSASTASVLRQSVSEPSKPIAISGDTPRSVDLTDQTSPAIAQADTLTVKSSTTLVGKLPFVWLCGAGLTALFVACGIAGSVRLRFTSTAMPVALRETIDEAMALVPGLRVSVKLSNLVNSPILLGIIRPAILLPTTAVGWPPETLRFVILHELAHAKRRDNFVNLIQRTFEVICFYQPAVWLGSAWVRTEREISCDELVAEATNEATRYAETLVMLASSPTRDFSHDLVTCSSTRHALVGRVARLVGKEETMRLRWQTIACGLACLLMSLPTMAALTREDLDPSLQNPETNNGSKTNSDNAKSGAVHPDDTTASLVQIFEIRPQTEFADRTIVFAQIAGNVKELAVNPGDHVKAGQTLGTLDATELENKIQDMRADRTATLELEFAKARLDVAEQKHLEAVKRKQSYSAAELANLAAEFKRARIEVETVRAHTEAKERQLKALQTKRKQAKLTAPNSGCITSISATRGVAVARGQAVFEITSLERLKAKFLAPVAIANKIQVGQHVSFKLTEGDSAPLSGKIVFKDVAVRRIDQTVECHAMLQNPGGRVRAGQAGRLAVMGSAEPGDPTRIAPEGAVETTITQRKTKRILDGRAAVELGDITAGQVRITVESRIKGNAPTTRKLIDKKSMRLGEVATFHLEDERFAIRIKQLTNVLIGQDFAVIESWPMKQTQGSGTDKQDIAGHQTIRITNASSDLIMDLVPMMFRNDDNPPRVKLSNDSKSLQVRASKAQFEEINKLVQRLEAAKRK